MENKYPEYIMLILRKRLGLEEDDTSMDQEINEMQPSEIFREVLHWNGIIGWDYDIKKWIRDIYSIDLSAEEIDEK